MPEQSHLAVKEETFEKPLPGMPMSMPPRMELREAHAIPPPTPPPFIMPLAPPLALLVPPLRPPPGPPPATVPAPPEAPRVVPAKYSAASQPSFSKSTSVVFAKRTGPMAAKTKLESRGVKTERLESQPMPRPKVLPVGASDPWTSTPKRGASRGEFHKKRFGRNLEDPLARPMRRRTK